MLIGFQICMSEQCAKPAFTNHPVCVERRAMEQRRRDAEQLEALSDFSIPSRL
jgi:hypothetical protein